MARKRVFRSLARGVGELSAMLLSLGACGDQVVGQFTSTTGGDTKAISSSSGSPSDTGPETGQTMGQTMGQTGGGSGEQPWGGGCLSDEFDQAALDRDLWNVWAEPGAGWTQTLGVLRFTPAPTGLAYTGITAGWRYQFPFDDAEISLEIATPPPDGAPVNVYLQLIEEPFVLSMRYGSGEIDVSITDGGGIGGRQSFPSPQAPRWLRIRGEADVVHFETSMDGLDWSTLDTQAQPTVFVRGRPLVMVETAGDHPEQAPVEIDRFDACAQF